MPFSDAIAHVLPARDGTIAHITGDYGESRASGPHGGVDFNYTGGQSGVNLTHPTVHAPIAGEIMFVGGHYGTIKIRDVDGNSHEILHTNTQSVTVGTQINAGDVIGTMGGRGPNGASQYAQHVHYQMKDAAGHLVSPQIWWETHPVAQSAPSSANWVYPFQKTETPTQGPSKAVEVVDPQTYYDALATAADGFYPVGANGFWHGGIHFDQLTAATLAQDAGVRCIADGEVIAYRIDSAYPTITYATGGDATYSRGFVLVKHRLQLPPKPKATTASPTTAAPATTAPAAAATAPASTTTAAAGPAPAAAGNASTAAPAVSMPTPTEEPSLILFSLYMHQLDWAGYVAKPDLPRPPHWADPNRFLVGAKAGDLNPYVTPATTDKGLNVRQGHSGHTSKIGWLPPSTQLTVEAGTAVWRKIASIDSGAMTADPTAAAAADAPLGWVYTKELNPAPAEPTIKDAVVVLDTPIAIKAGTVLGYLGQYGRYADRSALADSTRPLVHIEVFSGDDVPAFIETSKARGAELAISQKTLLVIDKGTALVMPAADGDTVAAGTDVRVTADSPKTGQWAKVQALASTPAPTRTNRNAVKIEPTGAAFWIERTLLGSNGQRGSTSTEISAWSAFPLQVADPAGPTAKSLRVAAIKTLKDTAVDDGGVRWWKIDVDPQEPNSNTLGWACETDHLQSPLQWPGFDIISDTVAPADLHGRQLIAQNQQTPADQDDLQAKAERAKQGELFQTLYDIIDVDKNESLSTDELRNALKTPWLAQTLSRVIAQYESEWGGEMSKWDALDAQMGDGLNDWIKEKERIASLQWWNELSGKRGFPTSPTAYHFHPVGLVANFKVVSSCMPLREAQLLALRVSGGYEGKSELDYHALADNFDNQGTSFGLIQWNFGQGTLGPVLLAMRSKDSAAFDACFPDNTDYETLKTALINSDQSAQISWAKNIIARNKAGWKAAFKAIGDNLDFQYIQLKSALVYHSNVVGCIRHMRSIAPNLTEKIEVIVYSALYDLCVQQNGFDKGSTVSNIRARTASEVPTTQKEFAVICVEERGKTASNRYAADATSRRMGILQQSPYSISLNGHSANKGNANFSLLKENEGVYVCDL